ncbi:MAG: LD-carboxypeptidase, partial [Bacteroidaceae bacterium]|nr:LD-carboxypeptidase [Bacteroidaceae bacterium]
IHASQCNHLSKFPDSFQANMLRDILFGKKPRYENVSHKLDIHGTATGKLAGGNLSVLTALIGTEYDIFKENIILFIEDIGEQPYRIERMMYQLELCGALSRIKGVIVGQFTGIKENPEFGEPYKIIHNIVKKYNIPVCFGFPVGHCDENVPLIEGAECMLTVAEDKTTLEVFEEIK